MIFTSPSAAIYILLMKNFPGVQRRFANAMTDYCYGVLSQVEVCSLGQNPSLEEVLALRRWSAGVSPLFPLVE